MRLRFAISMVLCLLALASAAARGQATRGADLSLTLPLQGYYRPGRFMPVRLTTASAPASQPIAVEVRAAGAIPTQIRRSGRDLNDLYPLLSYGPVSGLSLVVNGQTIDVDAALHPLTEEQRLIGSTIRRTDALAAVKPVLPGEPVLAVPLDPAGPLPGAAVAWEALDAVVLDPQALSRVGDIRAILNSGISIIVVNALSDAPPTSDQPWQRVGEAWVLVARLSGPRGVIVPELYASMSDWTPGRTRHVRQQVLVRGVLLSILALGLILWRPRWAPATVGALVLAFIVAAGSWVDGFGDLVSGMGRVAISHPAAPERFVQWDTWTCTSALRETQSSLGGRPAFASVRQMRRRKPMLQCEPGQNQWVQMSYTLEAGEMMASRNSAIGGRSLPEITSAKVTSPLLPLVKQHYLSGAEGGVVGQSDADPDLDWIERGNEWWGTIVVEDSRR